MKRPRFNQRVAACLRRIADKFAPGLEVVAPSGKTLKVRAAFGSEAPSRDVGSLGQRTTLIFALEEWERVQSLAASSAELEELKFRLDGAEWALDYGANVDYSEFAGVVVVYVYRVLKTR